MGGNSLREARRKIIKGKVVDDLVSDIKRAIIIPSGCWDLTKRLTNISRALIFIIEEVVK